MKRLSPLQQSLRAIVGLAVIVLQVVGALHFTLVRHGYSSVLGGVVHVHASARAEQKARVKLSAPKAVALVADVTDCAAELCPEGNAPPAFAPHIEPLATGWVAFGEVRLLNERSASTSDSRRVFLSAPKTSPPV